MISETPTAPALVRLSAHLAWKGDARIATKLHGFAMTEAGSAHDMFRAAELTDDPQHRRLFLRHALDEARHARRFRAAALDLDPSSRPRRFERTHALPQDLYRRLGPERFLAFVHLSEARARRQFTVLAEHFAARARDAGPARTLATMFSQIAHEERMHVAYSRHLLGQLYPEPIRERRVVKALARERRAMAWAAYKRAGVRLGGRFVTLLMALVFVLVLPIFALGLRVTRRGLPRPAWHPVTPSPDPVAAARRQA